MDWIIEPFELGFQQRALIGGVLAAVMSSVVGTWLVLQGMSFFGDAFVHGILPGAAAAVLLGVSPMLGAAAAALVMVLLIETVTRGTKLREDTAIGLMFVGMLALGVVIISQADSYSGSLTTILFGDVLGVTAAQLGQQAVLAVVVLAASVLLYRPFLTLVFSRQKAELLGMNPARTHVLLLLTVATAVVGSFQVVGTLLVFSLLVAPSATAALFTRSVPAMMLVSCLIAVASVAIGLIISFHAGTAGSATVALVPIAAFFVTLLGVKVRAGVRGARRTEVAL